MVDEAQAHAMLFQLTGVGVVQTDLVTGRFVRTNDTFREMVGYSEAELRSMTNAELTHPDDWERDARSFATLQRGESQGGTSLTRVVCKDGEVVWLELHVTVIGEGDEAVNLTVATDVSEQKRAEAVSRETEEYGRFLLRLSDALRAEPDADAVANRALRMLFEQLQLDRCYVGVYRLADDRGDFTHQVGNDRVPPVPDGVRLSDFPEALRVAFDRTLVIGDVAEMEGLSDTDRRNLGALGMRAFVAATLRQGENRPLWAIVAISARPRRWTRDEVTLIEEVTERTWAAVERARAEAVVHESEAKYRTLFETMGQGYCDLELLRDASGRAFDQRYLEFNPAFERIFGISVARARGRAASEVFPGLEPWWTEAFDRIARAGTPERVEYEVASLGRWFEVLAYPRGGDRLTVLYEDITERKRAEAERERLMVELAALNETLEQRVLERTEALRHSEQRFSQAFYVNPIPACMTTFGRETFVEINAAFLALTGYEHDEVVGHSSRELEMWSSPEDLKKLSEAQRDGKGFRNLDLKLRTKEGNLRDILISAEVIRLNGEEGYLKMFYDITERKQTEEELHEAVQEVMTDASWFSHKLMERLANIRSDGTKKLEVAELSRRERQVLERMARGMNNNAIATELGLKSQTVRNYITAIYEKLGVHSRVEAVVWARERGVGA